MPAVYLPKSTPPGSPRRAGPTSPRRRPKTWAPPDRIGRPFKGPAGSATDRRPRPSGFARPQAGRLRRNHSYAPNAKSVPQSWNHSKLQNPQYPVQTTIACPASAVPRDLGGCAAPGVLPPSPARRSDPNPFSASGASKRPKTLAFTAASRSVPRQHHQPTEHAAYLIRQGTLSVSTNKPPQRPKTGDRRDPPNHHTGPPRNTPSPSPFVPKRVAIMTPGTPRNQSRHSSTPKIRNFPPDQHPGTPSPHDRKPAGFRCPDRGKVARVFLHRIVALGLPPTRPWSSV